MKVFSRRYSSFSAASANFTTTQLSNSFQFFFFRQTSSMSSWVNYKCLTLWVIFSACFSLKSSTRAEYFSFFVLARSFENYCLQYLDLWVPQWTLITRASHATQWRHSCVCPLTDDRHRPITARVVSQLLYKKEYNISQVGHLQHRNVFNIQCWQCS